MAQSSRLLRNVKNKYLTNDCIDCVTRNNPNYFCYRFSSNSPPSPYHPSAGGNHCICGHKAGSHFSEFDKDVDCKAMYDDLKRQYPNGVGKFTLNHKKEALDDETPTKKQKTEISSELLKENLLRMFESGIHSDVTFEFGDSHGTLRGHRDILAARSPVFDKMFANDMKEKETGIIKIENGSYKAFSAMLRYMYGAKFPDDGGSYNRNLVLEILEFSRFYQLDELLRHCAHVLAQRMTIETALEDFIVSLNGESATQKLKKEAVKCILGNYETFKKDPVFQERILDKRKNEFFEAVARTCKP